MTVNKGKIVRLRVDVSSISGKARRDGLRDTGHGCTIQRGQTPSVNLIAHIREGVEGT
jgi:hypothetical protein